MRFIGIDPGESWVGIALLEVRSTTWKAESRVLEVKARSGLKELIEDTLNFGPAKTIAEDYRVRPVGHQSFTAGYTLRLLGALELMTAIQMGTWLTLLPGPSMDLDLLQLGRFIQPHHHTYPEHYQDHGAWRHAFSAWRVLGRHFMMEQKPLMERLRLTKHNDVLATHKELLSPRTRRSTNDLFSPLIKWKTL